MDNLRNTISVTTTANWSVTLGETFFICWITLPTDLKNWNFKKRKKKILPDTTMKLFIFGLNRNHQESNYFETSLSFSKLHKNYDKWGQSFFFFCDRRSEKFQLM